MPYHDTNLCAWSSECLQSVRGSEDYNLAMIKVTLSWKNMQPVIRARLHSSGGAEARAASQAQPQLGGALCHAAVHCPLPVSSHPHMVACGMLLVRCRQRDMIANVFPHLTHTGLALNPPPCRLCRVT